MQSPLQRKGKKVAWHKTCYASFTSKTHISRLQKSHEGTSSKMRLSDQDAGQADLPLHSEVVWKLSADACMFCQDTTTKGSLSSVTTFKMSDQILEASKYDQVACVHFAGVSDLIAAEGKYHTSCYMKFRRNASKTKESSAQTDVAMEWLIMEIKEAAAKAHVIQLSEVWKRYYDLAKKTEVEIPPSFISRTCTFKEKLQPCISDFIYKNDCITLPVPQTLLVPVKFGHVSFSTLLS